MLATHNAGRAVIGRFAAAAANDKTARRGRGSAPRRFPLWIGVEPA